MTDRQMMIRGTTRLIAHIGFPTDSFKAPMIYNPYFEKHGIDAVVVPMGCRPDDYPDLLRSLVRLSNFHGALITMPHKVSTVTLLDEASAAVEIAGSCNAVRLGPAGIIQGDMFDGEGFVRAVARKGLRLQAARALITGCGGVGSAIAASLAKAGVAEISLYDTNQPAMAALARRLSDRYPRLDVITGRNDPADRDLVVNATPLGMNPDDPLPMDVGRIAPGTLVGEVVMTRQITPFLAAAQARSCTCTLGSDMLFEMIPACLEFFSLRTTTPEELRELAQIAA